MADNSYKADSITVLKDLEAVNHISTQISKRGDIKRMSKMLNIDQAALARRLDEARILRKIPNLNKSKLVPLARTKLDRELDIFLKHNDINKLSTRTIYRSINSWRYELSSNPKKLLTEEQHNLIIGSLLGDASVRQRNKNCSFRVAHSKTHESYLLWKSNILSEFGQANLQSYKKILNNRTLITIEFSTKTHSVFNYYRNLFYKNGRKVVSNEILELLNPQSLAIWICDDGSYDTTQGYIVLCTNCYSLNEHEIMKEYFNEVWNLNPTIGFRDNKYYYLRFKQKDTQKLIKIIKPFIPKSMLYKIGGQNDK